LDALEICFEWWGEEEEMLEALYTGFFRSKIADFLNAQNESEWKDAWRK
jgi:hypothetical protein